MVKSLSELYSILLIGNCYPNREKFCDTCRTAAGGPPLPSLANRPDDSPYSIVDQVDPAINRYFVERI